MFRAELYRQVGGYREMFRFAQDSDLWLRMAEKARVAYLQEVRYVHRKEISSTSGAMRPAQKRFGELSHLCRQARLNGEPETPFLAEAGQLTAELAIAGPGQTGQENGAVADAAYLIGSQLWQNSDLRARKYFWQAIRARPFHVRAWWKLGACLNRELWRMPGAGRSA
jgi:hypothetical protein